MQLKSVLVLFFALLIGVSCKNTKNISAPTKPSFVTWDKKLIDLGKVKKGEKREMFFEMSNTSGTPIQVETIDACDCTTVEFPRSVIEIGGKRKFEVIFDSKDKDASETIPVNVFFKQMDAQGNPIIERIEYKFELML
jgi:peptidoglycan-associated lipoprotein